MTLASSRAFVPEQAERALQPSMNDFPMMLELPLGPELRDVAHPVEALAGLRSEGFRTLGTRDHPSGTRTPSNPEARR